MIWLVLTFLVMALDWYAVYKKKQRLGYLTKPGVTLLLFAWAWSYSHFPVLWSENSRLFWFLLSLGFSLLGDVLLMLPKERFIGGLGAFLLAYLAYIQGFGFNPNPITTSVPGKILALMIALLAWQVYSRLSRLFKEEDKKLRIPIALYIIVSSTMLYTAFLSLPTSGWHWIHSYLISGGALALVISDLILARNRFFQPIPQAKLKIRVSYHLGQLAIVVGAVLHYLAKAASS